MKLFEMEGFLRGKCVPGDMLVNETNAQYLVRKISGLEAQVKQLAAELSAVDAVHNEAVFISDEDYDKCPKQVQEIIRHLAVMKIPTYQSFVASLRAEGVEMLAAHHQSIVDKLDGDLLFGDGTRQHSAIAAAATYFAAQLRSKSEVQS